MCFFLHFENNLLEFLLLCSIRELFRQPFINEENFVFMTKLTKKRIKWLVDQVVKRKQKASEVAKVYNISERRVQQLVQSYIKKGKYPVLKKNRRPKTFLSEIQKERIDEAYSRTLLNPRIFL